MLKVQSKGSGRAIQRIPVNPFGDDDTDDLDDDDDDYDNDDVDDDD